MTLRWKWHGDRHAFRLKPRIGIHKNESARKRLELLAFYQQIERERRMNVLMGRPEDFDYLAQFKPNKIKPIGEIFKEFGL